MSKLPYMQFFVADWLSDESLGRCSLSGRGLWIDLLCLMHKAGRTGVITDRIENLSLLCRCPPTAFERGLADLQASGAADVMVCNDSVTIINRRMQREWKQREGNRLRVSKCRSKPARAQCNGPPIVQSTEVRVQKSESKKKKEHTERAAQPRYVRPTIDEVLLAGAKGGLPEHECRKFHAYYESNGWRVGKNPMKSLAGAIANWRLHWQERNHESNRKPDHSKGF